VIPPAEASPNIHARLAHLLNVLLGLAIVLFVLIAAVQATGWPRLSLHTEIEIDAPPERVWAIVSNLSAYPEWNPFITSAAGTLAKGERLRIRIVPPGGMPMTLSPKVLAMEPRGPLTWRGRLFAPGLFDGEHTFSVAPVGPAQTRFTQKETFRGILVPFFALTLNRNVRRGFLEMNLALKRKAERAEGFAVPRRA
jgi:hypothetical protein